MTEIRITLSIVFALLLILLITRSSSQQAKKIDLHIEVLGHVSPETMTSLQYAVNKTKSENSSVNFYVRRKYTAFAETDLLEYASSLKNTVTVFIEDDKLSHMSCIISSLTRSPLITLDGRVYELHKVDQCRYVISVSANSQSYALATRDLIKTNTEWRKIVILYKLEEATQVAQLQFILAANEMPRIHLLLMENRDDETDEDLLQRTWRNVVKAKPEVIIPLVEVHVINRLLQMKTCYLKTLTWIIQGKFPSNLSAMGQNIVVAFQLPLSNNSDIRSLKTTLKNTGHNSTTQTGIQESTLLSHDAVLLVAKAASEVTQDDRWNTSSNISSLPTNGEVLQEYITNINIEAFTGIIKFNSFLEREIGELEILNLQNNRHVKVGKWFKSGNVILSKAISVNADVDYCKEQPLEGHTIRITTIEAPPFVMQYKKGDGTTGIKGFCIDILNQLVNDLGFNYTIEYVPDNKYGALVNGKWNGLIRQVIDRKSDMAVAPLTVTEERDKVVDFTAAFHHYSNVMIMSKPVDKEYLFIFVEPLSHAIWFSLAGTVFVVGIITFLLNIFCPFGWKNENGNGTATEFSLFNSLWFSLACILQQGAADRPKALSGRIFAGVYWFFILVFVSTYTANLAAFFTAKSAAITINDIEDIIDTDYDVGVTMSSELYSFFKSTEYEAYQQLWNRMKSRHSFPNTTSTGIEWARTKKYIHIGSSPMLQYAAAQPPCDLKTVPGLSTPKGLAFALPQGSIYVKNITLSMLRMREKGILEEKQNYWWVEKAVCTKDDTNSMDSKKVHLKNMVGVYIVLGGGTVIAFIVLIIEMLWKRSAEQKLGKLSQNSNKTIETPVVPFNDKVSVCESAKI